VRLDPARPATARAQETGTHPATVGRLQRRFAQQGRLGLGPESLDIPPAPRQLRVPERVGQALQRLQGLYTGVGARALARIIFHTTRPRLTGQTARRLWERLPPAPPPVRPRFASHSPPARAQARQEVRTLYAPGWRQRSIRQFLHVSRPTLALWMTRFARDHPASRAAKRSAPPTPARQVWLPVMREMSPRHQGHPAAGGCRSWRLRGTPALSGRTVERLRALTRQVSTDMPGTHARHTRPAPPHPQPFKATGAHAYWLMDGRLLALAWQGQRWWSRILLEGSARTRRAGAVAPSEASWGAWTGLSTAGQRSGLPGHLIADRGGALISDAFEGVCRRLPLDHQTMVRPQGQSSLHGMATPGNLQRRLEDAQLALPPPPQEFAEAPPRFLELYNPTAHQGVLQEQFVPPLPVSGLGDSQGRLLSPQERTRKFAQALFGRTTNR